MCGDIDGEDWDAKFIAQFVNRNEAEASIPDEADVDVEEEPVPKQIGLAK